MPTNFTETKTTGYGKRITGSLRGVLVGILLFVISFGVLYWNEGRFDLSITAKKSEILSSTEVNSELNGKLVSVTGDLSTPGIIGDNLYLKPGKYVAVKRDVDMYAWEQRSDSNSTDNLGGSQTTTTNYTYEKDWKPVSFIGDSSKYKVPEGHENPEPAINNTLVKANAAQIGIYDLDISELTLPELNSLSLNNQNISLNNKSTIVDGNYIYVKEGGSGSYNNPSVGDLRVSYKVFSTDNIATVFGQLSGDNIVPHYDNKNRQLYHLLAGDRDAGISQLHSQYVLWVWIFRGIGFGLMFLGLMMIFSFFGVVLSIIPLLGQLGGISAQAAAFIMALVLSTITILVSIIFHNIFLLLAVIAIALYFILKRSKKKKK